MSKEQLLRRTAAVGAALGIALGATACENPFSDPNQISVCPVGWGDGAAKGQFGLSSMTQPDQFTVVDANTFRITVPRADRYLLLAGRCHAWCRPSQCRHKP